MDSFIIIIILYIVLYIILTVINIINQKKKRELIKEREEEILEEIKLTPPVIEKEFEIEEEKEKLKYESKEPEKIEIYEKVLINTQEKKDVKFEKEKLSDEETLYYEKIPKIKKILNFSKNDVLKGIIYKEILTPKFKKN